MAEYRNECCDCATESYPCKGNSCPNRRVPLYRCDGCGEDRKLYHWNGGEYCINCIEEDLEIVEGGE